MISPKALGVFLVAMVTVSGSTVLRAAEPDGPEALWADDGKRVVEPGRKS